MIARLREAGLQMESNAGKGPISSVLEGRTIVISGNFSISRDEMKTLIAAHGGKNSGSVSGKTSWLLAGEKPGPEKIRKAESLGVEIIDEARFMEMIGPASGKPAEDMAEDDAPLQSKGNGVEPKEGDQLSLF